MVAQEGINPVKAAKQLRNAHWAWSECYDKERGEGTARGGETWKADNGRKTRG